MESYNKALLYFADKESKLQGEILKAKGFQKMKLNRQLKDLRKDRSKLIGLIRKSTHHLDIGVHAMHL